MSADAQTNKQTSRHDKHKATLGPTGHAWSTHLTGKNCLSITITTSGNSSSEDGCRLGCEELYLFLCTYIIARGSHIDVACRSICDRDHKWNQAINVLFKSRSRYQDEFWATNINQSTHFLKYLAGVATFCPFNSHRIKRSRASERSDQAIKDDFPRSRFLIPVANASTGDVYVTTPCIAK